MRVWSAPGKLVLCGEYAVVDGRPAVVAAVDRRATAALEPALEDDAELRVRGNDPRWLRVTPALLDALPEDGEPEQPLLVAVLRETRKRGIALPHGRIHVSTTAFSTDAGKLGLGSSAAAAVAFTRALMPAASVDEVHDIARTAHRAFQGGGSGIDVAASAYGGVVVFESGRVTPAPSIPASIDVVVAYTGVSAKTQGFVNAWRALPDRGSHLEAISAATARFLAGSAAGSGVEVIAAVDDARRAMDAMGQAAHIDVVTAEHQRIAALTASVGGTAKPSGAGGGDVAVCFIPGERRAALVQSLEEAGFVVVPLHIGAQGARMDG